MYKETLRFKKNKMTIDVLVSSNSHFHPLLSYCNNFKWLPHRFLVRVLHLSFEFSQDLRFLEYSWVSLSFAFHIVAMLLWSCPYSFDAIIELRAMNQKKNKIQWLSQWKVNLYSICNEDIFIQFVSKKKDILNS